jgi:hypothetical protein
VNTKASNKPAAGNAGIASRLTIGHHWPGVPEPERWLPRYMRPILFFAIVLAFTGCRHTTLRGDASADLPKARAILEGVLPDDMRVSRAELLHLDEGTGILLHGSPKNPTNAHPMFALFLWPKTRPQNIAYETGAGSHTFRRVGSSEHYRVYYSGPSDIMRTQVENAFCAENENQPTSRLQRTPR